MTYDPDRHHRKSTRLRGYNYAQGGAYFVTIVTYGRECTLGHISADEMRLSQAGEIAARCWLQLPQHFPSTELDEYVIMPNHIHGIVVITGNGNQAATLGKIVRTFKAITSRYTRLAELLEFSWQRNYHDYIIRNEYDLNNIRQYVISNPARWAEDAENM